MALPSIANVRVLEEVGTFSPLGIRFWDAARSELVRAGLRVSAWRLGTTRPVREAFRSLSDVYAFRDLPGLRAVENGGSLAGSPAQIEYVVAVEDLRGELLPVAFQVALPLSYSGVFLGGSGPSSEWVGPEGFYLFSAPSRSSSPLLATIRGELVDATTGGPAAHAVVVARFQDGNELIGLADAQGRFAVMGPLPGPQEPFVASPATAAGAPLHERVWELQIEVRYQPDHLQELAPGHPDYLSVLTQGAAFIWPVPEDQGGAPQDALPATLLFGAPTTLSTDGRNELLVSPLSTSP